MPSFPSLAAFAHAIVSTPDLRQKTSLAFEASELWFNRHLSLRSALDKKDMPSRPGRPDEPQLLPPRDMPKRTYKGERGKLALVHSLAHIELNAVDLTWDMIARFVYRPMPRTFFDNFVQVGHEEAHHFSLLSNRLAALGSHYGALPAHDGLWQAAQETEHDLLARLAIIPLVLEARGLDIAPSMIIRMRETGDEETAAIMDIIYRDEKHHVAYGTKWFRYLCDREHCKPEPTFHAMVRKHFRGALKPPFNDRARSEAGLTPGFYKPLTSLTG